MEKKIVFSAKKWAEENIKLGIDDNSFAIYLKWVIQCHGKTPQEMKKMSYSCLDSWTIEIGVEE